MLLLLITSKIVIRFCSINKKSAFDGFYPRPVVFYSSPSSSPTDGTFLKKMLRRMSGVIGPVQSSIESKLQAAFAPTFLEVVNESSGHNVPKGSESHFKVVVVSDEFRSKSPIERHRSVNSILEDELITVHALSIVAKTPEQWARKSAVDPSPKCMGGSKR